MALKDVLDITVHTHVFYQVRLFLLKEGVLIGDCSFSYSEMGDPAEAP
jgi:hypothetical protein